MACFSGFLSRDQHDQFKTKENVCARIDLNLHERSGHLLTSTTVTRHNSSTWQCIGRRTDGTFGFSCCDNYLYEITQLRNIVLVIAVMTDVTSCN